MGDRDNPMTEEEINRLASLAKNGDAHERNEAWRRLEVEIRILAGYAAEKLGICSKITGNLRDEAPSILFERLVRYEEGKSFRRWTFTVLRNWMIDEYRKQRRKRTHETLDGFLEQVPQSLRGTKHRPYEDLPDLGRPFSDADLAQLEKDHTASARVIGLTVLNIWKNVPSGRWKAWLREAALPEDFPPLEVEQYDEPVERLERLAELLDVSEQSLRMRLSRFNRKFRSLGWLAKSADETA